MSSQVKNRIMAKVLLLILIISGVSNAQPTVIEQIVAVIDNDVILLSELKQAEINWRGKEALLPKAENYKLRVLEQLINDKLLSIYLTRKNSGLTTNEVENGLRQIARKNNINVPQLFLQAQQQGISPKQLRDKVRSDIKRIKLKNLLMPSGFVVNQTELERQLSATGKASLGQPQPTYHIGHILVPNQELALEIKNKIINGEDFRSLAKKYSDSKTALNGGDLGYLTLDKLPGEIGFSIANMNIGAVIVIESNGFNVFKLFAKRIARKFSQQERSQAVDLILERKLAVYIERLLSKLRQETLIEIRL